MTNQMSGDQPMLSIIIPNFNYGRFIGSAIRSALAVRWSRKEIIVVDDGSHDESWSVISSFEDRGVLAIRQQNVGQLIACQRGFARSRGDMVVFLDSDDLLAPDIMEHVAPLFRPGVTKVQVRMFVVDATGMPGGPDYPRFPQDIGPALIRDWVKGSSAYPTPPGSGNIYARTFLEQILPVDQPVDRALDSYCLSAAPLLGDIETVDAPLVGYRVHGANVGAMSSLQPEKFATELRRARLRTDYANRVSPNAAFVLPDPIVCSIPVLVQRASSLRLRAEDHPVAGDSRLKIAVDFTRALNRKHHFGTRAALLMWAWTMGILILPRPLARHLIGWRFAPVTRPWLVRRLASWA